MSCNQYVSNNRYLKIHQLVLFKYRWNLSLPYIKQTCSFWQKVTRLQSRAVFSVKVIWGFHICFDIFRFTQLIMFFSLCRNRPGIYWKWLHLSYKIWHIRQNFNRLHSESRLVSRIKYSYEILKCDYIAVSSFWCKATNPRNALCEKLLVDEKRVNWKYALKIQRERVGATWENKLSP